MNFRLSDKKVFELKSPEFWRGLRLFATVGTPMYLLVVISVSVSSSSNMRDSMGDLISAFKSEPGITVAHHISYDISENTSNHLELNKGDLYLPQNNSSQHPAIVILHGDSWSHDSKIDLEDITAARYFARNGYVVFNRQLSKSGDFPGEIMDAKKALAFLVDNKNKWHIDSNRLAVAGFSSGGFVAMMAAYTPDSWCTSNAPKFLKQNFKVRAVASFGGPTNLVPLAKNPDLQKYLPSDSNRYQFASPMTYTNTAVPTIFVHGIEDQNIPISQSETLCAALTTRHILTTMIRVEGQGHYLSNASLQLTLDKVLNFFNNVFNIPN